MLQVEWYETLGKACMNCPFNSADCHQTQCIYADGVKRNLLVVNRMMPGPALEVCLDDTIIVEVENNLVGEGTTIHWHGIHQKESTHSILCFDLNPFCQLLLELFI